MRLPRPDDIELMTLIRRYVNPPGQPVVRYMMLLHGNILGRAPHERRPFGVSLAHAARSITDHELGVLLDSEWRSRLTASWLIGLDRRMQFRAQLGALLLDSDECFAGQGYCFALGRFGTPQDAEILVSYLERYLPRRDCYYDQDWALGALMHLDGVHGTARAARYLGPGGLWEQGAMNDLDPAECRTDIENCLAFADACYADPPPSPL